MEDKILKRHVEDELQYQPGIDAAAVGVRVENGVAHVSGHVPTSTS